MPIMGLARAAMAGALMVLGACAAAPAVEDTPDDIRPVARWDFHPEAPVWTDQALQMLETDARTLVDTVPQDIAAWCPAYTTASRPQRAAFWVGFLSALAEHESTWRPDAVGGNGRWFGLVQISPQTARGYGCRARTGADLMVGAANLRCALRIMSHTVPRDAAISLDRRGVAADWGPLVQPAKREAIRAWVSRQSYCQLDA